MTQKIYISKEKKYYMDIKNSLEQMEFEKVAYVNDVTKFKLRPFKNSIQVVIMLKK